MAYGWLHIQYSSGRSEDVEISKSPLTLGRATDNDVVLNDTGVASYHLCITATHTGCQVTDLHSQSGTTLNDQRLVPDQAYPLEPDSRIRCGNIQIEFSTDDIQLAPAPTTTSTPAPAAIPAERSNALGAPAAAAAALPAAAMLANSIGATTQPLGVGAAAAAGSAVRASTQPDGSDGGGVAGPRLPTPSTSNGGRGADRPTRPLFTRTPITPATDATKPLSTPASGATIPLSTDPAANSGLEERLSALPPGMPGMLQRRQTQRLEDIVLSPPPPTLSETAFDQPAPRQRTVNRRRPEPQPVVPYDESAPPSPIRIDLPAVNPSVQPGKTVLLPVTLVNRSRIVERIEVRVMNLPTGWAKVTPESVSLFPGEQGQVEIEITPPNDHTSLAGPHNFQVIAYPQQRPSDRVTENKIINVLPFHQFVLEMEHLQQTALRRGEYDFQVINTGNVALPLYWEGSNEENALGFRFTPTGANLEPGATARAKARITLRGVRWLGKGNIYPFSIRARSTEDQNLMEQLGGRLVHRPLRLRLITLSLILPLLVVGCILASIYLVPKAKSAVTDVRTWVVERADAITGSNNAAANRTATAAADAGAVGTPSAAEGTPETDGTSLADQELAASQATAQAAGTAAAAGTASVAATVVIPTLIPTSGPTAQLAPTPISVAQILQTFLPSTPTVPAPVVPAGSEGAGGSAGSGSGAATGPTTTPNRLTATPGAASTTAAKAAAAASAGPQSSVLVTPNTSQTCPTTFNFSAIITLEAPGTVIYQWERSDGTYSPEQTLVFTRAGSQIVTTIWQVNVSMVGWMRIRPLTANTAVSNQASFTLACPPEPSSILTEVGPTMRALCLATFRFTSTIAMDAPGVLTYKWERSDGSLSANKLITFTSPGLQTVTDTWRLQLPPGVNFNGWGRLRTVSVDPVVSNQAPFLMLCPALPTFGGGGDGSGTGGATSTPDPSGGGTVRTPTRTPTSVGTTAPVTGTATMTPTPTPIPKVTGLTASVKNGFLTVCPGNFQLDGTITLDRGGTVDYRWESMDGKTASPTFSLTFSQAGTLPVPTYSWLLPGSTPTTYGIYLKTLTPTALSSTLVSLRLECKVAYIYNGDTGTAALYKNLLNTRGLSVTLVPITNTARTDFKPYQTILIGYDTGSASQWGSISSVITVTRSLKPIVGIGNGGHAFFGKVQLAIGWSSRPYTYKQAQQVYPYSISDPIWFNPYALAPKQDLIMALYTADVPAIGAYERSISDSGAQNEVVPIGSDLNSFNAGARSFFVVSQRAASNSQLNTLWGFEGSPKELTAAGENLFMNVVLKR